MILSNDMIYLELTNEYFRGLNQEYFIRNVKYSPIDLDTFFYEYFDVSRAVDMEVFI